MVENFSAKDILENLTVGVALIDQEFNIFYTNNLITEITGYTLNDISTLQEWFEAAYPDSALRNEVKYNFFTKIKKGSYKDVFKIKTKNSGYKYIEFRVKELNNKKLMVNIIDVSKRKSREKEIATIKNRLELAVDAAEIGIWDWNIKNNKIYYNRFWTEMIGYQEDELAQTIYTWFDLIYAKDELKVKENLQAHLSGETDLYKCEYRLESKNGDLIWIRDVGKVITRDNKDNPERAIGIHININEYKKREKRIEYLSFHDDLTGLYNRRYLENEMRRLSESRKYPISIIVGDLDNLKAVNDNYGHQMGDEYIVKSSHVFEEVLRSEDIAARTGGDEFAILLPETDHEDVKQICQRIQNNFAKYNKQSEFPAEFKISLGHSTMKNKEIDPFLVYNIADQNMYINKGRK